LIVDDVATTGATLSAAAAALRDAGAVDVAAITAARTPPPRARDLGAGILPGTP
jgi:adenine/guanine phosphoribosyltransferase-like PRPP-binding protein